MLLKLYEKSKILFAVSWIAAYCVLVSFGDYLSLKIGILKIVTLPILIGLSVILLLFVMKNGLTERYGLCKPKIPSNLMLFYSPFVILLTANFWYGFSLNESLIETVLYILSMLFVGFLEEIIFRGLLFNAMSENGIKFAVVVSSLTFGVGHFMNLINGSGMQLLHNILQVLYSIAVGFAFVMVYHKTKSMLSCILTHGLFNAASIFSNEAASTNDQLVVSGIMITLIAGAYALYIAIIVKEGTVSKVADRS